MRTGIVRLISLSSLVAAAGCGEADRSMTGPEPGPALASAMLSYTAVDLGSLPGQPASGSASDVNDSRQVVGSTAYGTDLVRAFLWENGRMRNLGTLGGAWSTAAALNNEGQVVGTSARGDGKLRAFRWTSGKMLGLGTLGGSRSEATDINSKGHVVGWSYLTGDRRLDPELEPITHAFLWRNGRMIDLGTLGGPNSRATAINDDGSVVGESETAAGENRAFLWRTV